MQRKKMRQKENGKNQRGGEHSDHPQERNLNRMSRADIHAALAAFALKIPARHAVKQANGGSRTQMRTLAAAGAGMTGYVEFSEDAAAKERINSP